MWISEKYIKLDLWSKLVMDIINLRSVVVYQFDFDSIVFGLESRHISYMIGVFFNYLFFTVQYKVMDALFQIGKIVWI